jgi:cystathionine gamma-synthase
MVLVEAVSNPTLRVADLIGLSTLLKSKNVLLAIDNTFTTPLSLKPVNHGADIIIHSVTKLLAGHSDATLGYVWAADATVNKSIYDFAVTTGLTPSPFDCWLAERGLLTFPLRFEKAQENAKALADALAQQEVVKRVLYPLRQDHPDILLAEALLAGQGCNMVSFELNEQTREAANKFVQNARGIAFAPTLGDVGTTLSHPASSSHRALRPDQRASLGISEGFFRVSVGVEDISLLISTFNTALKSL